MLFLFITLSAQSQDKIPKEAKSMLDQMTFIELWNNG